MYLNMIEFLNHFKQGVVYEVYFVDRDRVDWFIVCES